MPGIVLLLSQALIYFCVMAALFRARTVLGSGAFLCALGVMHFLETYLAAVFFVQLPFGAVSPGSTVLFAGKLAIILMVYIREDAETVRQPIYGLLIGNFLIVALVLLLRLYTPPMVMPGYNADLSFVDQMGILMVWGSSLLFIDSIAMCQIALKVSPLIALKFSPLGTRADVPRSPRLSWSGLLGRGDFGVQCAMEDDVVRRGF